MLPFRAFLLCTLLVLAFAVNTAQSQPPARDVYGDPLPPGAVARLGTMRFRHDGTILFAAFHPGGKSVSSVSNDGVICVWEFPSGKEIRRFEAFPAKERLTGSAARVTSLSLSPNGKYLTAFCSDGFLRIWDWASAKQLGKVANVAGASGTTDLSEMASALDRFESGGSFKSARGRAAAVTRGPVYSPDGNTLMLVGTSGVLQFVDLPTGKEVGPSLGHTAALTSIEFTRDGKRVLTKDTKATHLWDAATGKDLGTSHLKLPPNPGSPTIISPDGRVGVTVARFASPARARAAEAREAVLFDPASGEVLGEIALEVEVTPIHRKPILFSPDSKTLAVSLGSDEQAKERIAVYEVPSGKLLRTLTVSPSPAAPAAPLGKGKKKKGAGPAGPGGAGPGGAAPFQFQPAGKGGGKGILASAAAQKMLFSPDGKVLAFQSSASNAIVLLDTATGKQLGSLRPPEGGALTLQGTFAPDGRCLALRLRDGTVTLYELATGQPRRTYGGRLPPAVEDDAFETARAAFLGIDAPLPARSSVSFALSPDGKLLAFASPDGTVPVVDVLTGKELAVFKGHTGAVNAVAFSPSGKTLASASSDMTALIWDVTRIKRAPAPARAPRPGDLDAWWQALAESDSARAFAAMGSFAAAPNDAVAFLQARLKPAAPPDRKRIEELIGELNDKQFKVRDRATRELLKLGEQIVPQIDQALAANPLPEPQSRLQELRGKLTAWGLPGERLRGLRAVEVLEHIGTPEAREVLQGLAKGAPGALLTQSAQAALKR